ncbi:hypothetical protein FDUTEX481_09565 [Tolypothrix sp. PCC 7601]|nr:hypothetical protein FDUTEX481_09565 [Tolypothrix sp. PCC 7601]
MLGGGWGKVKGKRVRDKNLSPLPRQGNLAYYSSANCPSFL